MKPIYKPKGRGTMTGIARTQVRADFSRTCKGCSHVVDESAGKGKLWARCTAPGPKQGRVVGYKFFPPYVPAWCPLMQRKEADNGAKG